MTTSPVGFRKTLPPLFPNGRRWAACVGVMNPETAKKFLILIIRRILSRSCRYPLAVPGSLRWIGDCLEGRRNPRASGRTLRQKAAHRVNGSRFRVGCQAEAADHCLWGLHPHLGPAKGPEAAPSGWSPQGPHWSVEQEPEHPTGRDFRGCGFLRLPGSASVAANTYPSKPRSRGVY